MRGNTIMQTLQNNPRRDLKQALEFYEVVYDSDLGLEATEFRLLRRKGKGGREQLSFVSEPDRIQNDFEELARYNDQGWEVFAVINRIHPETMDAIERGQPTGKKKSGEFRYSTGDENIVGVRAIFVDLDKPGPHDDGRTNLDRLTQAELTPQVIVNTSGYDKLQAYWLVQGVTVPEFKPAQQQFLKIYGGDKTVVNPARVMRLPGFLHLKGEPVLTRLVRGTTLWH